MKRWVVGIVGMALVGGCAGGGSGPRPVGEPAEAAQRPSPATRPAVAPGPVTHASVGADDEVIARAGNVQVTRGQLVEPLIEGHGLDMLLQLITLELTRDTARRQGISVSEPDVERELELTVQKMVGDVPPEDYERLLQQFMNQYRLTRPQLYVTMETNAYLRKLAEPMLEGKITEEALRNAFGALYGETVQVRHIQLTNMQEVAEAQGRLQQGDDFAAVAREMSRNVRTAGLGGELPPFSRQMQGLPDSFKETAFTLKEGEVSDAVQSDGAYHLIKLEKRVPPKAVEFEDHQETVREQLYDNMMMQAMKQLRQQIAAEAIARLNIQHPLLREQYDDRRRAQEMDEGDRDDVLRDMQRRREAREAEAAGRGDATEREDEDRREDEQDQPAAGPTAAPTTAPAQAR